MNARQVFHLQSYLLLIVAASMAVCWAAGAYYQDPWPAQRSMAWSATATCLAGIVMWFFTRGPVDLSRKDGIGVVTFGWLTTVLAGSIPFLLTGTLTNPVDALFESVSGFTTTGASVFTELESVPRCILLWRAVSHFLGGMGILVLCIAILPFLGAGGMQLYRAEVAGPSKDRLTPRIASTAKLLWGVYILLNGVLILALRLAGMDWFDSICHAFAAVATGGFSTRTAGIAAYQSPLIEGILVVFMLLGAVNFSLHYRALRGDPACYGRDSEFRFFLGFWATACGLVFLDLVLHVYPTWTESLRHAVFCVTSMVSTTGFCTVDYDRWPDFSRYILIAVTIIGGCVGSTAGAIKQLRLMVVLKIIWREIRIFMQPQAVIPIKIKRDLIEASIVSNIAAFFALYLVTFGVASLAMTWFAPDMATAMSSVAVTMAGCGPGLGAVGPVLNYAALPDAGKLVLVACMLLGRLEFYTMLIVFMPSFWRR